jgi:hypothetical protein
MFRMDGFLSVLQKRTGGLYRELIATTMDELHFQLPPPATDIEEIRKLHRAAVEEAQASGGNNANGHRE